MYANSYTIRTRVPKSLGKLMYSLTNISTPPLSAPSPVAKGGGLCHVKRTQATETLTTTTTQRTDFRNRPGGEHMTWRNLPTKRLSYMTAIRIATWNVRTMYETGKAAQVRWNIAGRKTLAFGETVLILGHLKKIQCTHMESDAC